MKARLYGLGWVALLLAACGGGSDSSISQAAAPVAISAAPASSVAAQDPEPAATAPGSSAPTTPAPAAPAPAAPAPGSSPAPNPADRPASRYCDPVSSTGQTLFRNCNDPSLTPLLLGSFAGKTETGEGCTVELAASGMLRLRLGALGYQAGFDGDERDFSIISNTPSFAGQSLNAHEPSTGVQIFLIHSTDNQQIGALLSNSNTDISYPQTYCGAEQPAESLAGKVEISGTIRVADTADVDSDTNDVTQANWRRNNSVSQAQSITNPVLVSGYVNQPRSGAPGRTFADGDPDDLYRVSLQPGQVVELEFNGDPKETDLDLWVFGGDGILQGRSIGDTSRHECVRITAAGQFLIDVNAFAGAANYLLRIGSPSSASDCPNSTDSTNSRNDFVVNELIASTRTDLANAAGTSIKSNPPAGPKLLRLPDFAGQISASQGSAGQGSAGPRSTNEPLTSAGSNSLKSLLHQAGLADSSGSAAGSVELDIADVLRRELPDATLARMNTLRAAKLLQRTGNFNYVSTNNWNNSYQLMSQDFGSLPSNDRYYRFQSWNHDLISLPAAFSALQTLGNPASRRPWVALIDSGVFLAHPDLAAMFARRADGTVEGYDFVATSSNAGDGDGIDSNPDDLTSLIAGNPTRFHGTHTAGIVAAQGFNSDGITGAAPLARLMPMRALGVNGGSDFDVIQSILYAAGLPNQSGRLPERRADVINMSLGRQGTCSTAVQDAIQRARQQGVIIVAAAGNDASNRIGKPMPVGSPANCTGVISVGAVGALGTVSDYSNSGAGLTIVAPGGDLGVGNTGSGNPDGVFSTLAGFDGDGVRVASYGFLQGTSMAAPHVSAVIALVKFINPNLSPVQIDQLIADGKFTIDLGNAGRDALSGYGLLNAAKALQAGIESINAPPPPGIVEASPAALSFGVSMVESEFELRRSGPGTEQVTRVSWTYPAEVQVVAKPGASDGTSLLGKYLVRVNRTNLTQSIFPVITIETSVGRRLQVNLTIEPAPVGGVTARSGTAGTIYLLVVDAKTNVSMQTLTLQVRNGQYAFSALVPSGQPIYLVAGHDLDNNFLLCDRGEACGDYPPLGSGITSLTVTEPLRGLDFSLAPYGGFGAAQFGPSFNGRPVRTSRLAR